MATKRQWLSILASLVIAITLAFFVPAFVFAEGDNGDDSEIIAPEQNELNEDEGEGGDAVDPIVFEHEELALDMSDFCNYSDKNNYDKDVYYTLNLVSGKADSFGSSKNSVVRIEDEEETSVKLYLRQPGAATIRAYDEDGNVAATCRIEVTATLRDIAVKPEDSNGYYDYDYDYDGGRTYIAPEKSLKLMASPCPSFAPITGGITWSSTDNEYAEVDENGLVTFKKRGAVSITAKADDVEGSYVVKWSGTATTDDGYTYKVKDDGTAEITAYNGSAEEIVIPEKLDGFAVTSIAGRERWYDGVFSSCDHLKKVTIPKSVESIGASAFSSCARLQKVVVNSDSDIPDRAFYECKYLTEVQLNGKPKNIGTYAFYECTSLKKIVIPEGLEEIGGNAFYYSGLNSITLPSSLKTIGGGAFAEASVGALNIGANVESIGLTGGVAAFNVAAGNSNYSSKGGVLFNKSGDTLILYPGKASAFHYTVPNGTGTIGKNAFAFADSTYDKGLHQLDFPETVKVIEESALPSTWNRLEIVFPKSLKRIDESNIPSVDDNYKLYYKGSKTDWNKIDIDIYENNGLTEGNITYNHNKTGLKLAKTSVSCTYAESPQIKLTYVDGTAVKYDDIITCSTNESVAYAGRNGKAGGNASSIYIYPNSYPKPTKGKVTVCVVAGGYAKDITVNVTGPTPLSKCTFTWGFVRWKNGNPVYDGKVQKPSFALNTADGSSIYSENYTYKYSNNKNVGTAKVTITGKGLCTGTITKTFSIVPDQTYILAESYGKNYITFKWQKEARQTTGYQIQYGLKKDFKGAKTVWIKNNKTIKKKIGKLKSKKVYYYRIRTYKKIGTKYYYSKWSSRLARKTK